MIGKASFSCYDLFNYENEEWRQVMIVHLGGLN